MLPDEVIASAVAGPGQGLGTAHRSQFTVLEMNNRVTDDVNQWACWSSQANESVSTIEVDFLLYGLCNWILKHLREP